MEKTMRTTTSKSPEHTVIQGERKRYEQPAVVFESKMEARAGSPLSLWPEPWSAGIGDDQTLP